MFQMMIQDLLSLAEAGPQQEELLERLNRLIKGFEAFESGELVVRMASGVSRFVIAPGLGEAAVPALEAIEALGAERTLRLDTVADLRDHGVPRSRDLTSVLILRVEAPGVTSAAIVLGHSRAWSFAAAPLSRVRALGNVALRLLLRTPAPAPAPARNPVPIPDPDVARLKAHVLSLEAEIVRLRAERASKSRGGKTSDR